MTVRYIPDRALRFAGWNGTHWMLAASHLPPHSSLPIIHLRGPPGRCGPKERKKALIPTVKTCLYSTLGRSVQTRRLLAHLEDITHHSKSINHSISHPKQAHRRRRAL